MDIWKGDLTYLHTYPGRDPRQARIVFPQEVPPHGVIFHYQGKSRLNECYIRPSTVVQPSVVCELKEGKWPHLNLVALLMQLHEEWLPGLQEYFTHHLRPGGMVSQSAAGQFSVKKWLAQHRTTPERVVAESEIVMQLRLRHPITVDEITAILALPKHLEIGEIDAFSIAGCGAKTVEEWIRKGSKQVSNLHVQYD